MRYWIITAFAAALAMAQTFEVASVKPSVSDNSGRITKRGPGPADPGRIHYAGITLKRLLINAYDVKPFQIEGPNWLDTAEYDVDATMPPETMPAQLKVMLRNLLTERFKMALRRETRDLPIYALVVTKGGPKLKDSSSLPYDSGPPPRPSAPPKPDPDGFPPASDVAGHRGIFNMKMPDRYRIVGQQQSMQDLADRLTLEFDRAVNDETGLASKYDFTLTFSPETAQAGPFPDLFAALQAQLGLKLEQKKAPLPVIVIEHAEKTPVEN